MAILRLIVVATVAVAVRAEAEAEAGAQVHHGGQYGYTPVPAPYGPEPAYHVAAPYGPQPAYNEAPVYEAAVTPFVHHNVGPVAHAPLAHAVHAPVVAHSAHHASHGVAHHGAAHHQSVVQHHVAPVHAVHGVAHGVAHHGVAHHAVAHHAVAAPYHEPKHDDYKPPACSVDNPKTWCLEDAEYPTYEIEHALQYHYEGVQAIYKDVLANTENSVDRLKELVEETYLCPSETAYIMPLRAVNTDGKWRVVVNGVKAHYETLTQTARIEECTTAGEACPLVPACYETKCLQKSIYHRFLVYDAYDHYFPFAIETFQLPSACACYNGAYVEPPHRK